MPRDARITGIEPPPAVKKTMVTRKKRAAGEADRPEIKMPHWARLLSSGFFGPDYEGPFLQTPPILDGERDRA